MNHGNGTDSNSSSSWNMGVGSVCQVFSSTDNISTDAIAANSRFIPP